jgi:hypothetical protein
MTGKEVQEIISNLEDISNLLITSDPSKHSCEKIALYKLGRLSQRLEHMLHSIRQLRKKMKCEICTKKIRPTEIYTNFYYCGNCNWTYEYERKKD